MSPIAQPLPTSPHTQPTTHCAKCHKILSSPIIKSLHIISCPLCSTIQYCSPTCQSTHFIESHALECEYSSAHFWRVGVVERFGGDYMKERSLRCACWAVLCMLNCENQKQRDFVYQLLCTMQPVNMRWVAVLREEHARVMSNDEVPKKYWDMAEKVWRWFDENVTVDEASDSSDSEGSDEELQSWKHDRTESLLAQPGGESTLPSRIRNPHHPAHKIISRETYTPLSFHKAQEWFLDSNQHDLIDNAPSSSWEQRDWKILGVNLVHMQIGDWYPVRSFDYQSRLHVDLANSALCYHFFTFKATNWRDLDADMKTSLLSGDEKTRCLYFLNEMERFVNGSRHVMMYVPLENVVGISSHSTKVDKLRESCPQVLVLDLAAPPRFFEETPRLDYTCKWQEVTDFTENQEASRRSRHFLILNEPERDKIVSLILTMAGKDSDLYRQWNSTPMQDAGDFDESEVRPRTKNIRKAPPLQFSRNPEN